MQDSFILVVNDMVTTSKLENERLDKLKNLSNKEMDEYIEKLVLDSYKGIRGNGVKDTQEMDDAIDKLDEITNITLQRNPNCNIKEVIKDRKFRYMNLAYLSAVYTMENLKISLIDSIRFTRDVTPLLSYYSSLIHMLRIYYAVYSNYGFMEDLLFELSDDGLVVDSDIHEKYTKSKEYRFNQNVMRYLDLEIKVSVDLILDEIAKLDEKYLVNHDQEIDDAIDRIRDGIKDFYKNNGDFEICAYKQCGLLDAQLDSIKDLTIDSNKNKEYLDLKNKIMKLIDGNGFAELSADEFEKYKKRNPDADFTDWVKKEPKYDVRNAKFIYPLNIES